VPKKEAPVYDESADARADVKAALARAKSENRRVLIQWGANWCGWCRKLHATMATNANLAKKLMYEYDVVRIDVGQFNKNLDLAKELGAEIHAIPYLTVLDADGKALIQQPTDPFEINEGDTHAHDPAKVLDFLTKFQAPYRNAADLLTGALAQAKADHRRVFVHFGAPWCPWCHRLDEWLAQKDVGSLLAKDFLELKIDTDRTLGGKELLAAQRARAGITQDGGIPWIVLLDAEGDVVGHGDTEKGNLGFPYEPAEVAAFVSILQQAKVNLTDADVAALKDSLVAFRAEFEKRRSAPTHE
jgi:thiol-disulfide isomerase/thioredoxin